MIKKIPSQMTRVLVLTVGVLAAGVVAGAPQAVALTPVAASAGYVETKADAGERPGCIGPTFGQGRINRTLEPGKAICNGNYLVRMQPNGDLVLREISSGRACWASGTRAPGDASATFIPPKAHPDYPDAEAAAAGDIEIESASLGLLRVLDGSLDVGITDSNPPPANASVSDKGEFYAGFTRVAGC
jgi:hypothetical protein